VPQIPVKQLLGVIAQAEANGAGTVDVERVLNLVAGSNVTISPPVNAGGKTEITISASSGGGPQLLQLHASMPGQASATTGAMQWVTGDNGSSGSTIGIFAQSTAGNPGINNGSICPILFPACTLVRARMVKFGAAVAQASIGGAMTARVNLYDVGATSRSLMTSIDFPVTTAGVFNNVSGNNFERVGPLTLSQAIAANTLLGLEFQNRSANNNEINGIARAYVLLEFEL
jgi:hypothetical protein